VQNSKSTFLLQIASPTNLLLLSHLDNLCNFDDLQPWRWRKYVYLECLYLSTSPHSVTTQKTNIDIFTSLRTSNLIQLTCLLPSVHSPGEASVKKFLFQVVNDDTDVETNMEHLRGWPCLYNYFLSDIAAWSRPVTLFPHQLWGFPVLQMCIRSDVCFL
jgi:hypothetical protein